MKFHEIKSPLLLHMELTSACNHKCIHCYNYWREADSSAQVMSKEDLHKILANVTAAQIPNIVFTGGEPLVCPDLLFEAIDIAQTNGINCSINSNVTLLTDEIAQKIKYRDVSILTSFPSYDEDTFNFIVNKNGAYQKALRGVQVAIRHEIPLMANMVLMKQNAKDVFSTGSFLREFGVTSFAATKVQPVINSKNYESFKISSEELSHALDELILLKKEGMHVETLNCYPMCAFKDIARYEDLFEQRSCMAGVTSAAIGSNGEMRACAHSDKNYGNAASESISDIWHRMADWRNGAYMPVICQSCKWEEKCGGGCRVSGEASSNSLAGMDEIANPDNINSINYMRPDVQLPNIDSDVLLFVNPNIEFREEDCGAFIKCGGDVQLVTKATIDLLQDLIKEPVSINGLVDKYKIPDPKQFKMFMSSLSRENFIYLQDNKEATNNVRKEETCQANNTCHIKRKAMNSDLSL